MISNKIFLSSGGFSSMKPSESIDVINKSKIFNIELSSGIYQNNIRDLIKKKSSLNKLILHNYFPPPKQPIVINLASSDISIRKKSLSIIKKSIDLTKMIGGKVISFHGGFRFDIELGLIGRKLKKKKLIKETEAEKNFLKSCKEINRYLGKYKMTVLIENNVLSYKNYNVFKENPLLFCEPNQIIKFLKKLPENFGLLLDVAHLKVSSNSINFNLLEAHEKLKKYIKAYHISDNDGKSDSNSLINKKSWFLKLLKKNVLYYSLEVYNQNLNILKNQMKLLDKNLR